VGHSRDGIQLAEPTAQAASTGSFFATLGHLYFNQLR
jgi:hypothetical protein